MSSKPDNRLSTVADMIDTGAILQARDQLANLHRTPIASVMLAEVAIQFGNLEEANSLLEGCSASLTILDDVARFARAEGELHLARRQYEKAAGRFEAAAYLNELLKSKFGLSWALYGRARVAFAFGHFKEAENYLNQAHNGLRLRVDDKGTYLQGLLNLSLARIKQRTGDQEESERLFNLSLDQLSKTERLRHYALALVGYAELHQARGQYGDSIPLLEEAIALFRQHSLQNDLAHALVVGSQSLAMLKRSEDAERSLVEAVDLYITGSDEKGQCTALLALASLYLKRRFIPKAQQAIEKALAIARRINDVRLLATGLIIHGRILLVVKETQASIEVLKQALSSSDELSRHQQAQVQIYLAEAYHGFHVTRGQEYLDHATALMEGQQDASLKSEYDMVVNKYRRERIVVSGENKFIIDGNLLPEWEDAKRGLEIFLLRNALKQSENNMTQAGKLLGISKVHVHTRRKQYGL